MMTRPAPRSRTFAPALVVLALVAAATVACTGDPALTFEEGASGTVAVDLRAGPDRPSATLRFGLARQAGAIGNTCWSKQDASGGVTGCGDTFGTELFPKAYVEVPRGTKLQITGDADKVTGAIGTISTKKGDPALEPVQELAFEGGEALIDVPPGDYTMQITGEWPQGTAPFSFGLRIP
jgi:hypothetical protein